MEALILALFWIFFAWLAWRRAIMLTMAASLSLSPFGAFSVVPTQLAAGLTILPSVMMALLALGQFVVSGPGGRFVHRTAFSVSRLGLMTAFLCVAVVSAFLYPRLFAGAVEVVPMSGVLEDVAGSWTPLAPSIQNITQLCYLTLSVLGVFFYAMVMQVPRYRQLILRAMVVSGTIQVVAGALDYAGLSVVLEPFRTASYVLLTDAEVVGGKRVVGLTPEASVYGPSCVGAAVLLYLFRDAFDSARLRRAVLVLVPLLLVFAVLSTSSAAYLALGVAGATLGLRAAIGFVRPRLDGPPCSPAPWLLATAAALSIAVAIYLLQPGVYSYVGYLYDTFVTGKTQSSSFDQRMAWNQTSFDALLATYGIGVGVGATRASSLPVAIVTNLGVPGALLLLAFALRVLFGRKLYRDRAEAVLCAGGLWALAPILSTNLLTATSPNFGLGIAMILGIHAACLPAFRAPASRMPAPANPLIAAGASAPGQRSG